VTIVFDRVIGGQTCQLQIVS